MRKERKTILLCYLKVGVILPFIKIFVESESSGRVHNPAFGREQIICLVQNMESNFGQRSLQNMDRGPDFLQRRNLNGCSNLVQRSERISRDFIFYFQFTMLQFLALTKSRPLSSKRKAVFTSWYT